MFRGHVSSSHLGVNAPGCYMMSSYSLDAAVKGELPPWEVCKAFAFHTVLERVVEILETPAAELLGERVDDFIASQLTLKGGGHPTARTVRRVIARCQDPEWYPGKPSEQRKGAGRKPVYSEHARNEVARVAMELKDLRRDRFASLGREKSACTLLSPPAAQASFRQPWPQEVSVYIAIATSADRRRRRRTLPSLYSSLRVALPGAFLDVGTTPLRLIAKN